MDSSTTSTSAPNLKPRSPKQASQVRRPGEETAMSKVDKAPRQNESGAELEALHGMKPLQLLQQVSRVMASTEEGGGLVGKAAHSVATYHKPVGTQATRHQVLQEALVDFLAVLVQMAPSGPERSTAIARAREAKFWASAAVALEEVNAQETGERE
jgi:hypothetical protein